MTPPVERLTNGRWNAQHRYLTGPSLSADGSMLVVLGDRGRPARGSYDPDAGLQVFAADLRRRDARPPIVSADGRWILYTSGRHEFRAGYPTELDQR